MRGLREPLLCRERDVPEGHRVECYDRIHRNSLELEQAMSTAARWDFVVAHDSEVKGPVFGSRLIETCLAREEWRMWMWNWGRNMGRVP